MTVPFFSVIIATHARPSLLERAINSIHKQSFKDVEIIVVADENSKDTFAVAVQNLEDKDVFIKRTGIPGPAVSRNVGIHLARGKYILFLDDDDTQEAICLSKLVEFLTGNNFDIVYFDYHIVMESRHTNPPQMIDHMAIQLGGRSLLDLPNHNFIPNNAIAFNRGVFKQLKFDDRLRTHEDWDFLIAAMTDGWSFTYLPFLGVNIHQDKNEVTRNSDIPSKNTFHAIDFFHIYRKWPAQDQLQQERRFAILQHLGLNVNSEWL